MRIAVVLPSRGLIFSQTAEELLNNLEHYDYEIFFSHNLSIPDCFEVPLNRALKDNTFTHILMIEEDMILPEGTLGRLVEADAPVVTCDYPVGKNGQGAVFKNKEGEVMFTGTGCLLIERKVFDKLEPPYFRDDISWGITNHGKFMRFNARDNKRKDQYGLHDVTFGLRLYKYGIPISVTDTIGQRKLIALGKTGTNDGAHNIEEWTKVVPDLLYKRYKKHPVSPTGKLITVQTDDGVMNVHPNFGKKLIKNGKAKTIVTKSVGVDYGEYNL